MDNERKQITVGDEKGKNQIVIRTEEEQGNISIKTDKKLTITVGDSIKVTMNADSGTINVKCNKLMVNASDSGKISTNGKLGLSGGNVAIEASSMLKAGSSGMTPIGGSPIKIG